jgi:hypothetical protein
VWVVVGWLQVPTSPPSHAAARWQGECNVALLGLILDACAADSTVLHPLVMVFGALLSALHVRSGE